jgi:hypothetical protein
MFLHNNETYINETLFQLFIKQLFKKVKNTEQGEGRRHVEGVFLLGDLLQAKGEPGQVQKKEDDNQEGADPGQPEVLGSPARVRISSVDHA